MSRFINQKTDVPPRLFHAIPGEAVGGFINASANWGMKIQPPEREKLGIGAEDHPPLVFAATCLTKALAFTVGKGEGRLINTSIDSADAEILVTGDRRNFMAQPRSATIYTFSSEGFVNLPNAEHQSVSLHSVPLDRANVALKINNIEDIMRAGLQIFTFKEDAEAIYKDNDALKLSTAPNNKELVDRLGLLISSGKVVWENNSRGLNPNPELAKQLGIAVNPPKLTSDAKKSCPSPHR